MVGEERARGDRRRPVARPDRRREPLRALHRPVPTIAADGPETGGRTAVRGGTRRPTGELAGALAAVVCAIAAAVVVWPLLQVEPERAAPDTVFALQATPTVVTEPSTTTVPERGAAIAPVANAAGEVVGFDPIAGDLGEALTVMEDALTLPQVGRYTDLLRDYFGPHALEALIIVQCESSFRPDAVGTNTNGTQDHGLFQINDIHRSTFEAATGLSWDARYDPEVNTSFAAWLHRRSGWRPWTCNRNLVAFD